MINGDEFKYHARAFRKAAQSAGVERKVTTLMDVFAYAHYGRAYSPIKCQATLYGIPDLPDSPPFLKQTAERYGLPEPLLRQLIVTQKEASPCALPEQFVDLHTANTVIANFRRALRGRGIDLAIDAIREFFCRMHFDQPWKEIVDQLNRGSKIELAELPEFLVATCVMYDVEIRSVYAALSD